MYLQFSFPLCGWESFSLEKYWVWLKTSWLFWWCKNVYHTFCCSEEPAGPQNLCGVSLWCERCSSAVIMVKISGINGWAWMVTFPWEWAVWFRKQKCAHLEEYMALCGGMQLVDVTNTLDVNLLPSGVEVHDFLSFVHYTFLL